MNISVPLHIMKNDQTNLLAISGASRLLKKMAVLTEILQTDQEIEAAQSFMGMRQKYFVQLPVELDIEAEKTELQKEISYQEGFINSVLKKLENERFVSSAPKDLVAKERKKLEDGQSRLIALRERLESITNDE